MKIFYIIGSVVWGLVHSIPKIVRQPSLWPEKQRKSAIRRYMELCYFRFMRHGICLGYNGLGLDIKGVPVRDVLINSDRRRRFEFWVARQQRDWTMVVSDKYLLYLYLKAHNLPVVPVFAHIIGGGGVYLGDKYCTIEDLGKYLSAMDDSFIMKATNEMCGKCVYKLWTRNGRVYSEESDVPFDFANISRQTDCIFQPVVSNHEGLRQFNDSTLNTLRLNTCWNKNGEVEMWDGGFIRIGHKGSTVDNFSAGGIAVGVNSDDGSLKEYGISHDSKFNYTLYAEHPDSHISFAGCRVPRYFEAVEIVKRAQRLFPTIPCIGWDVCITEDDILILEGNWNWGIEEIEMINGYHAMNRWREIYGNWRCK